MGGIRGYDGAKKMNGRKRHLLVDTQGLVLTAKVHSAALQDRATVPLLLAGAPEQFPRLSHVWVDQGYTGTGRVWIETHLGWSVEVEQHPPKPRADLQLADTKSKAQQRLRAAVRDQRSSDLRCHESPHGAPSGQKLTFSDSLY